MVAAKKNPAFGDEDENSMSARSVAIIAKKFSEWFPWDFEDFINSNPNFPSKWIRNN